MFMTKFLKLDCLTCHKKKMRVIELATVRALTFTLGKRSFDIKRY